LSKAEPFDFHLSKQVQKLREESEKLTEEVVKARKSLPADRAQALQTISQLMDERRARSERKRRTREAGAEERTHRTADADRPKGEG
jgi:hypothetical protein